MAGQTRILITGANGFIGRALWRHLTDRKHIRLYGADKTKGDRGKHVFACDLCSANDVRCLLKAVRPRIVFHLAGGRYHDEAEMLISNVVSTRVLCSALVDGARNNSRVIIPGSAAEYGSLRKGKQQLSERDKARPQNWYGLVKHWQTTLALTYTDRLDVRVARIFNIAGAGTPPELAVGSFARQITAMETRGGQKILRAAGLSARRDVLDIDDVCAGLWRVAVAGKRGEIYNICSGHAHTMARILQIMTALSAARRIRVKADAGFGMGIAHSVGNNRKLLRLGWAPEKTLEESLAQTLEYYRQGGGGR